MATDKKLTELTEATVIADADLLYVSSGGVSKKVFGSKLATNPSVVAALALKAPLASPTLTGTPTAPTAVVGTNTTQLATTAFVNAEIANDTFSKTELTMAIGNINSPLLDMPLKNSLAMKSGVGSATFTRASTATYIDRYGVLKTAGVDEPRFEKEGYLNEGASTNLHLHGEFDSGWSTARCTHSYSSAVSPMGDAKASTVTCDGTKEAYTYIKQTSITAGNDYTFSFFYKAGTYIGNMRAYLHSEAFGSSAYIEFTKDGDFVAKFNSSILKSYKIEKLTNGWMRVAVQGTATVSYSGTALYCGIIWTAYTPQAGENFYVYGAQLEALPFATSYIPTVASEVTRSADVLSVTRASNFPNAQNNEDGFTVLCDVDSFGLVASSTSQYFWSIGDNTNTNIAYSLIYGNVGTVRNSAYNASGSTINSAILSLTNTKRRICSIQSNSIFKMYADGVLIDSDTNTTWKITETANNLSTFNIGGAYNTDAKLYGHISNFRIYDKALSSAEVALA